MQRRYFEAIADALNAVRPPCEDEQAWRMWQRTVSRMSQMCREQNPRFDNKRFLIACGCEAAKLLEKA